MRSYTFYIDDERYSVPTLMFVLAEDDAEARDLAAQKLLESEFYSGVAVWVDDQELPELRATRLP